MYGNYFVSDDNAVHNNILDILRLEHGTPVIHSYRLSGIVVLHWKSKLYLLKHNKDFSKT